MSKRTRYGTFEAKYVQEHPDTKDVAMFAQQFRERLTAFVVKDIFQEEGLENIGDVTLRILKDYAEGKGIEIINDQFNMEQTNLSVETDAVQNGTYHELTRLTQETFGPYYPFNVKFPEAYEMATEAAMFMAKNLQKVGINVEVLSSDAVTAFLKRRKEEELPDMSIGNDGPCKVTFYDYKKFNREDILAHPDTMWVTPKFASYVNSNGEVISITNPSFVKDETIQIGMFDFHFARLDHLKEIVAVGALPEELKNSISGIVSKKNTELRNALRLECALVDYLGSHGGRFDFPNTGERCYSTMNNGYWGSEPNGQLYTSGFGYWQAGYGDFYKIQSMEISGDNLLFNWSSSIRGRKNYPGKTYSWAWRRACPFIHRGEIRDLYKDVFKMDERSLSSENNFIDFIARYSKIPTLSEHVKTSLSKTDGLPYDELLALKNQLFNGIKTPIPLKYSDKELSYVLVTEENANGVQYDILSGPRKSGNKQTPIDSKLSTDFKGVKLIEYESSEDKHPWKEKQLFVKKYYWNKEKKEYLELSPMVYHIPKEGLVIIKRNNYDYFVTSPEHFNRHFNITEEGKCRLKQSAVEFSLSDGTVYGFQMGNTIYLTPAGINPNTPIHEYAHIWAKAYEKLHPEEWTSLKEELHAVPLWEEIQNSTDYQHISGDENRLAGEVLATIVGNKGEELLVKYAQEHPDTKDVAMFAQQFRERLTTFAVQDVFGINGLDKTGKVTLQVLKDFADGSKIELDVNDISASNQHLYKDLVSRANKASYLLESDPVKSLVGTEFLPKEGGSLTEQVAGYFDSIGRFADSKEYGKVILDKKGAEDSLAHGIGRNKAIAYAAVKDVIENGVTLDYVKNHKNRGYDSALIAAPISIKGERYICEVVVKIKKNSVPRFHLHEVTPQKNLLQAVSLTNLGEIPSAPTGDIAKVLQKTIQAKFYLDLFPQSKHIPNMENSNLPADTNIALNGTALELTRLTQEAFGPYYPFNVKFPEPIALKDGDQTIEAVGMMMDASGNYVLRFASDSDYNHNFYSEIYPENRALEEFGTISIPEKTKQAYEVGMYNLNEALSYSTFTPGERYEALLSQNKDAIFHAVNETKQQLKDAAEKVEVQIQSLEALTKALPDGVYPATTEVIFTPYNQKDLEVGGISPVFKPTLVDLVVGKNPQTNEREVLYRLRDYPEDVQLTTIDARSLAERHGNDPAFRKAEQMLMDIQNEKVREPALSWFNALSLEDKYRAFSFYRPSRPDESPDLVVPGFIEDSLDREHIWRTYETAIGVPQDIAGVDDELVNKSINEMFEKTFALLSSTTLVQMQTELQLSGLGVKEEKTLSAEQDGIRYAPNGKVSNLSEEDWKLVRTPEFKQWFGDWENDPENASKVLDENGEPKALWHGSNRDFEEFDFSRLGQNLGGGEWHDRKTNEKIPDDSEKAFFFSSSKEQAISYTLLAQFKNYEVIRKDLDNLIMIFSASRFFIPFKTKAELHDTLERTSKLVPELKPILDEINANPQRKPVTDVIDNWPKDELSAIMDVLIAKRDSVIKSVHEMDRGGLSNSIFNNTRQMETVVSVINDIERLRRNDATVKNEFGTFERFSFSIFGASGNQEMDIYFDEGRCKVWIDKGKPVFLDEQNDEFVKNLCETMLSKCNAAIGRVNNEIVNTGYAENANLYRVFLNIRTPLSHDYESSPFPDKYKDTKHPTGYIAARQTAKALREGNDGVIYQNIRDPFLSDSYGVFNPKQIKIAGKEHEIKVKFTPVEVEYNADRTLEMIVTAFTGGEEMTRAAFYRATQFLSDAEFASLKEEVKTVSLDVYAEKRSAMEGATPEQIEKERERNERSVEGLSHSWFRPWTRLAGRIENDIEMKISAEGAKAVDEAYFAALCESYASRAEYHPFLEKEFKGFVCNRCKDLYLDYSKMPDSLRTDELMNEILGTHPYILESKEWEMMGTAYNLGEKDVAMTLDEGPTHENGYIGGEVKWSSFLPINGPVLPEGKITGIGQIDYKDCTNSYFIINGNEKVVNFHAVPVMVRRKVLEKVYMQNRYGSRRMTVTKNHQMTVSEQPYKKPKGDDLPHRERLIEKSKTGFDKMLSSLFSKPNETQKQVSQTKK